MRKPVRKQVALEVVDAEKCSIGSEREPLGVGEADQQGADKTGAVGGGNQVDLLLGDPLLPERLPHKNRELPQVVARRDFGDDASELRMDLRLRVDKVGEEFLIGRSANDGDRCLIARGLDRQCEGQLSLGSLSGHWTASGSSTPM